MKINEIEQKPTRYQVLITIIKSINNDNFSKITFALIPILKIINIISISIGCWIGLFAFRREMEITNLSN
jgi:hypothetical protein